MYNVRVRVRVRVCVCVSTYAYTYLLWVHTSMYQLPAKRTLSASYSTYIHIAQGSQWMCVCVCVCVYI
jgi:hypothetical protein